MMLRGTLFGLVARGLRKFAGQMALSVAATVCATAIYGHIVSERAPVPREAGAIASASRAEGGVIDARTLAYYPEHLAALDSLASFHPVSAQRTAELAGATATTRIASFDAARPGHTGSAEVLRPMRPTLAQVSVLPPRRPVVSPLPAQTTVAVASPAEPAPSHAKIWGMELPHFVPTGASVLDKLASVKDRIGGLIHVSSR